MFLNREIRQYVEYLKCLGYTVRSLETYDYGAKAFQQYLQGEEIQSLDEINRKVIMDYQMYLMNRQPGIAINTQCVQLSILKNFMKYFVKAGKLLFNPASELELPKQRSKLPQGIMSVKEVKKILKQPNVNERLGLRDRAMLEVLYATAIRNQELRNLKLNDLNLKERTLHVVGGKGGKDRIVPLSPRACEYLGEYIQKVRPTLVKDREEQIVFLGIRKMSLSRNMVSSIVVDYAKKSGLKKHITPHSFRHSCATHMLKNRASLRHIQVLLGHKSLETTQKYVRIEITDLKRAHQKYHPLSK